MDSIHQAKVKSDNLLHKIALVQSQRNSTVQCVLITMSVFPNSREQPLEILYSKVPKPPDFWGQTLIMGAG